MSLYPFNACIADNKMIKCQLIQCSAWKRVYNAFLCLMFGLVFIVHY